MEGNTFYYILLYLLVAANFIKSSVLSPQLTSSPLHKIQLYVMVSNVIHFIAMHVIAVKCTTMNECSSNALYCNALGDAIIRDRRAIVELSWVGPLSANTADHAKHIIIIIIITITIIVIVIVIIIITTIIIISVIDRLIF